MNALEMVRMVPEIEKHLTDDMSRQIYEFRMDYAIYKNVEQFRKNISKLKIKWNYKSNFEGFVDSINPKRIIIFGAGDWGKQTLRMLNRSKYKHLEIIVCDNDKKKWNKNILGNFTTISPKEAIKIEDSIIIISSRDYKKELYNQAIELGYPKERISMPVFEITGNQYFDYFKPNENEIFVDGGSLNGMSAVKFKDWATKGYDYIYSFEANPNAVKSCEDTFKEYNLKGEVINKGLWNNKDILNFNINEVTFGNSKINESGGITIETSTLDEVLNGKKVTFIKMDIEGAEYNALLGCEKTIKSWRPRLAICVYHKPEDIFEIPSLLLSMQSDYNFALRQYTSHGTETVLYAY